MCTVSYIPTQDGFILTSNRDEDPKRETSAPEMISLPGGTRVVAPRDIEKGGTWIALGENGRLGCLLNGAFGRHYRTPPYRKSRGHLVFEALDSPDLDNYFAQTDLANMEPFTLLLIEPGCIRKLLWDGTSKFYWALPSGTVQLWSSPTLYSPAQHAAKELYFKNALRKIGMAAKDLLTIHGRTNETPFILKRPEVRTVSISQVEYHDGQAKFKYHVKEPNNEKARLVSTAIV